jgi:Fe2+ or Zn2+ uptake regulation protein
MDHIFIPLRRIILLQGLEQAAGRELSNELLQRLLMANGHRCSLAEVNEQINWLENRGYVKTTRLSAPGFILVHLTRPGVEVATGLVRAEGIDPPPEE